MKARVLSNRRIASEVYEMTFEWKGKKPHPGQFLMIDCQGKTFLKRPFSVNDFEEEKMTILYQVRGEGTKNLSQMKEGYILEITGPHGNGFEILEGKRVLIVGGGVGIAPLLYLAKKVKAQKLYIALGFKRETFLVEKFEGLGEVVVTTEEGSTVRKGLVTSAVEEMIGEVDIVYGCGPKPMLKALQEISMKANVLCQISLEEKMACGIGACLGCACKVRENKGFSYKRVCRDGPVFWAEEVLF